MRQSWCRHLEVAASKSAEGESDGEVNSRLQSPVIAGTDISNVALLIMAGIAAAAVALVMDVHDDLNARGLGPGF
jgi:hypothetical protein